MYDYLIVGAGFSGCTLAERIASQLGKKVLLVDKRNHIGGNAFDYYDNHGVLIHKYGPHIFHTNAKRVVDYLSYFTDWRGYFHKVLAVVEGEKVPLPFNLNSIAQLFPAKFAEKLETELIKTFGYGVKIPILTLKKSVSGELKWLAEYILENVFNGYTIKQWGMKPEELDESVTARVPVLISRDNRYFQDTYQQMPKYGYSKMFERMLNRQNIHLMLNTEFKSIEKSGIKFNAVIYTGPIDEFFDYSFGELPYRSLRFEFETVKMERFQETAQINYPNNARYTRITEYKYLTGMENTKTTISYEYPEVYNVKKNIPYYPIPRNENKIIYERYAKEKSKLKKVIFCGRLSDYKYYNMDQVVLRALSVFDDEVLGKQKLRKVSALQ